MFGWLKSLVVGRSSTSDPQIDWSELTAARLEAKRKAQLAEWRKVKSNGPLPTNMSRKDVETAFKNLGYKKRVLDGTSRFQKPMPVRLVWFGIGLRTFPESEMSAPRQRLLMSCYVSSDDYAAVGAEIIGEDPQIAWPIVGLGQRPIKDFVLTADRVSEAIRAFEAEACEVDINLVLAGFRDLRTDAPGSAGPRHLAALALAGDIERLDGYVRRRMDNDTCGFAAFITDDMISRAAKIAHRHG